MKNTVLFACPSWARYLVKLVCFIAFGSASGACCLLNLLLLFYGIYENNYNSIDN